MFNQLQKLPTNTVFNKFNSNREYDFFFKKIHLTETNMHCDSFNAPQHPKKAMIMTSVATPTNISRPMYTSFFPWVSDTKSEVSVRAHPKRVNAAIPAACKRTK